MPGPQPAPRVSINPRLKQAVHRHGQPVWTLSVMSGFGRSLSDFLHHPFPATPLNLDRLGTLADLIDFPRDQILAEPDEPQDIDAQLRETSQLLTRAFKVFAPDSSLVGCAQTANAIVEGMRNGDHTPALVIRAVCKALLDASDCAAREGHE